MFNNDRKQKYINEKLNTKGLKDNFISLFKQTELLETKLNIDLCEFDIVNMQEFINNAKIKSAAGVESIALFIKQYCDWCKEQGYIDSVRWKYDRSAFDVTKAARMYMVKSPLHLQTKLNEVFDDEEDETISVIYRCYFWIAFSGINYNDAKDITTNDVNLITRTINIRGVKYPIYEEGLLAFKKCKELKYFIYNHTESSGKEYSVKRDRAPGDLLLRRYNGTNIQCIKEEVSRKYKEAFNNGETDCKLSYVRVVSSGCFYRTWQKEIAGCVDFREEARQYSEIRDLKDNLTTTTRWYKRDYEIWKMTLNN